MGLTDAELLAVLRPWLPQRRWFAAKGQRITGLEIVGRTSLGEDIEHLSVAVEIDGAEPQVYQVPVILLAEPQAGSLIGAAGDGYLHDGLAHEAVMVALLAASGAVAELDPRRTGMAACAQWLKATPGVRDYRVLAVEQSNTSAVYASTVLVKAFRMLRAGINPDVEVHAGLLQAGSHDVGRLLGWVNGGWNDPHTRRPVYGHLAMIQEYFAGSVTGWDLAGADEGFVAQAWALGATTARVHRDLATAFGTQDLGSADITTMVTRLHERLAVAVNLVPGLATMGPALHERVQRIASLDTVTVQRVHGDLHLGQVLRTRDGWRIVDFEGEPGLEIESRRGLDHPMRDVAAMRRSFAYVAWQAGHEGQVWQRQCDSAFVDGYAATSGVDPADHAILLQAYTVDKAAYEAVYEQRNRPDWIEIPISSLRELLAGT